MAQDSSLAKLVASLAARQAFLLTPGGEVLAYAGPDRVPSPWMVELARRSANERRPILDPRPPDPAFKSALCVPLKNQLLYLDSQKALDLQAVDRARAYRRTFRPHPVMLVAAVAVLWLIGGFYLPPSAPPPEPSRTPPPSFEQVSISYLGCLQRGQYAAAYELLSASARAGLSSQEFEQKARAYAEDADHRFELGSRPVMRRSEDALEVGDWSWTGVQENGAWRLDRMTGPLKIPDD